MTERQLFGRDDVERLVTVYDNLVAELSKDYRNQSQDEIWFASEEVERVLTEMGFYDV